MPLNETCLRETLFYIPPNKMNLLTCMSSPINAIPKTVKFLTETHA